MVGRARIELQALQENQGRATSATTIERRGLRDILAAVKRATRWRQGDQACSYKSLQNRFVCGFRTISNALPLSRKDCRWDPNRLATVGMTGRRNAARILDEVCLHQWATESCQGTSPIVNQDRNSNFKRTTGKSLRCNSWHEGWASGYCCMTWVGLAYTKPSQNWLEWCHLFQMLGPKPSGLGFYAV